MDQTPQRPTSSPAGSFAVGYGNGYGYAAAPSRSTAIAPEVAQDPSFARTVVLPVSDPAPQVELLDPGPPEPTGLWLRRGVALGIALAVVVAAIVVLLVARSGAATLTGASSPSHPAARQAGQGRVDAHGDLIADSITVLPPADDGRHPATTGPDAPGTSDPVPGPVVTTPPLTTAPSTSAPVTTPTVPVTTTTPTTAPVTTSTTAVTTTSTAPPAVSISTFHHPTSVACGNPADPVPSIPLSWTTQHAVKVTISIDGPGIYKTYLGANGSDTVPFSCPGPHTYLITAYSATNQVATQQVVIAAT